MLAAGNFLFSGTITGNAYVAGDTYTIPSGSLTASLTLASLNAITTSFLTQVFLTQTLLGPVLLVEHLQLSADCR
jgi:hypothetical protein